MWGPTGLDHEPILYDDAQDRACRGCGYVVCECSLRPTPIVVNIKGAARVSGFMPPEESADQKRARELEEVEAKRKRARELWSAAVEAKVTWAKEAGVPPMAPFSIKVPHAVYTVLDRFEIAELASSLVDVGRYRSHRGGATIQAAYVP